MRSNSAVRADASQLCARAQELKSHCHDLRLRAQQARARAQALREAQRRPPESAPPPPTQPPDRHAMALVVLRAIGNVLDQLPLDLQVVIVKALTARILIKAAEYQAAPLTLSA